jgi:hypothetical protein
MHHTARLRPPCRPDQQFEVDLTALDKQYKLLQWSLHPDKARP